MTDNEIIKALEICVDFVGGGEAMCNNCPLHDCDNCSSEKLKQALDLINRQQAEIERLECSIISQDEEKLSYVAMLIKEEQERIRLEQIRRLEAEIERLRNTVKTDFLTVTEKLKFSQSEIGDIRTEAIKEFAERLKERAFHDMNDGEAIVCCCDIDNLVEEMCENRHEKLEKMCEKDEEK